MSKWKRSKSLGLLALWSGLSAIAWYRLHQRFEPHSPVAPVRTGVGPLVSASEPWNSGLNQSESFRLSLSQMTQELESYLGPSNKPPVQSQKLSESEIDKNPSVFLEVLFHILRHLPQKSLAGNGYELLLRRWPEHREDLDLLLIWSDLKVRRLEKIPQRLRSLSRMRKHAYTLLMEAQYLAILGQEERSFSSFQSADQAFKDESLVRMRAAKPVDLWVESYEVLLFQLAEHYLQRTWWEPATKVLTRLTEQQADSTRLSALFESLRSHRPLVRAG